MDRLLAELIRLYLLPADEPRAGADASRPEGPVRALVVAVSRPADWHALSPLWRGVQAELGWPAPAIAVSGSDALQLWFSLAQPVLPALAAETAARLRDRFLPEAAHRVRVWPDADALSSPMPPLPGGTVAPDRWSAFVAPDLAPVFADAPWLDIPPGEEAQGGVLAALRSVTAQEFGDGLRHLRGEAGTVPTAGDTTVVAATPAQGPEPGTGRSSVRADPVQFLQQVMNDSTAPLALRIEAAKALLQASPARSPP